jgi:hypothetical protein
MLLYHIKRFILHWKRNGYNSAFYRMWKIYITQNLPEKKREQVEQVRQVATWPTSGFPHAQG